MQFFALFMSAVFLTVSLSSQENRRRAASLGAETLAAPTFLAPPSPACEESRLILIEANLPAATLLLAAGMTFEQYWVIPAVLAAVAAVGIWRWIARKRAEKYLRDNAELISLQELILEVVKKISDNSFLARLHYMSQLATISSEHGIDESGRIPLWKLFDLVLQEYADDGGDKRWVRERLKKLPIKEKMPTQEDLDREHRKNEEKFLAGLTKEGVQETATTLVEVLHRSRMPLLVKIFERFDLVPLLIETLKSQGLAVPEQIKTGLSPFSLDTVAASL